MFRARFLSKFGIRWKMTRTCLVGMVVTMFLASVFALAYMRSESQYVELKLSLENVDNTEKTQILLLGHPRKPKGFLTIGISSVHRKNANYLLSTVRSLVKRSTLRQQRNVTVVIFLADFNSTLRQKTANEIFVQFYPQIQSGFLQVIQAPLETYPPLTNLRRTYGDDSKRVTWRAKQAIDYAYLFDYAKNMSEYFLLLEDDLVCSHMYMTAITNRIRAESNRDWLAIHFTEFMVIGMTFKSTFLTDLSLYLKLFYATQPVDFLILEFFKMLVPDKDAIVHHSPSLFQHLGYFSSLEGKVQTWIDNSFKE